MCLQESQSPSNEQSRDNDDSSQPVSASSSVVSSTVSTSTASVADGGEPASACDAETRSESIDSAKSARPPSGVSSAAVVPGAPADVSAVHAVHDITNIDSDTNDADDVASSPDVIISDDTSSNNSHYDDGSASGADSAAGSPRLGAAGAAHRAELYGDESSSPQYDTDSHADMLCAIRTPRVYTSAKRRSAARILRNARMRKIKRSFPAQVNFVSSPTYDTCNVFSAASIASRGIDPTQNVCNLLAKSRGMMPLTDKNFNSCITASPQDAATADDADSAHHSHSEMDTSRSSQSSEGSACSSHPEQLDHSTDDSGINSDQPPPRRRDDVDGNDVIEGSQTTTTLKRCYTPADEEVDDVIADGVSDDGDDDVLSNDDTRPVLSRELHVGDLVWGASRGYPSWPGKLVAGTDVRSAAQRQSGKLWVRWFGDHSVSQEEPAKLKTLSEGLEAHFKERQKARKYEPLK